MYSRQIQRYFQIFPDEQIKIYSYDEFKKNNQTIIEDICKFLEIPTFKIDSMSNSNKARIIKNKYYQKIYTKFRPLLAKIISSELKLKIKNHIFTTKGLPHLSENERKIISHYFFDDINELKKITSIDISNWGS